MATIDVEKEIAELKRRVDLTETRRSQADGRFEFISGQLRDIQLYMHAKFNDQEQRLDSIERKIETMDRKIETMDQKIDALPRVIAELIAGNR